MSDARPDIFTVTLNPAVDRTVRIPRFATGQVNRVESESVRAGGKGINVATLLADYGFAVGALGFLGHDNAALFTEHFARHHVTDLCVRLPGHTRTGIKVTDPIQGGTTDINFPGLTPTSDALERLRAQLADQPMSWCVLAGSLPPGVSVGIYRELMTMLKKRGVRAVLDTSGEALREALKAAPEIIKPNVHELSALVGSDLNNESEIVSAARELITGGVRLVVVSRGEAGACFVTADEVVLATPPAIEVTSTVGAGDAMVAGIVAGQSQGLPLSECARLATAFSVYALTSGARPAEEPASDIRREIDALKASVRITQK